MTDDSPEGEIEIVARLTKRQAGRLADILKRAAKYEESLEDARQFRAIAHQIKAKGGTPFNHTQPVCRPLEDDAIALQRVLRGEEPFPVLSLDDAKRAFLILDSRKTARQIAELLHVSYRTVFRWRRDRRNGKWKEPDD